MRWLYLTIIIVFATVIVIFVQNLGVVTMAFLGFSVRAPLAILAVVVYVLGAATGSTLYAFLRKSVQGSGTSM
jgi:lipopolysaccharide assembly protein A